MIKNEEDLKAIIRNLFTNDFRIYEEVLGEYEFEGEIRKVKADFILAPKQVLIGKFDFPKGFFVIETTFLKLQSIPEFSGLYIQCLTYNSTFRDQYPFGVFHYTNIDYDFFPKTKESRINEIMCCTFGKLNIGRIEVENQSYEFKLHKNDSFFWFKNNKYSKAKSNLLSISFGSGNNKIHKKY